MVTAVRLRRFSTALLLAFAAAAHAGSRVVVSATLNSTLQFFDAGDFHELQPPLPSRGGGPVRLWVQRFGAKTFLLAANHSLGEGSVGVFDLGGPLVTELPLSPFPARPGPVGVAAGNVNVGGGAVPMVFVTNTWFALGPCSAMPAGSVTAYDASLLESAGILAEVATVTTSGAIPYAVSVDEKDGLAFVSNNCTGTLDTIAIGSGRLAYYGAPPAAGGVAVTNAGSRNVGRGPDATLFDPDRGRSYTNNIGGNSITVYDAHGPTPLATVPLPGAGPIDANFGTGPKGQAWIVTSDGGSDSVSVVDRDKIETCVQSLGRGASCPSAVVLTVKTKVPGGAPEGVDYDPVTKRIFTVNKGILRPSLSVIQIAEAADGTLTGEDIHQIPISAVDAAVPAPALIAFDVVVEKP